MAPLETCFFDPATSTLIAVRISAFRAFVQRSFGAAKHAGRALVRKVRNGFDRVDLSTGVGAEESRFGANASRVWVEFLEETRERILAIFEKSGFDRYFPRFERFLRKILGGSFGPKKSAPFRLVGPGDSSPNEELSLDDEDSETSRRLRMEVDRIRREAHTRGRAGLRQHVAKHRTSRNRD